MLKKILVWFHIRGKNNKIICEKAGICHNILFANRNFCIKGNNNVVRIKCDNNKHIVRSLPKNLTIQINGDNNLVEFEYPLKISSTKIYMNSSNNTFSIKSSSNALESAHFSINHGSSVIIGKDSEIGNGNLYVVLNSSPCKLVIGDDVHIARDTIIRTSDGQSLIDPETMLPTDPPEDVILGNHVWIMSRCIILKGSYISDGSAVAANSLVNKKFKEQNLLLGGTPAKILRHNIRWGEPYKDYMDKLKQNNKVL